MTQIYSTEKGFHYFDAICRDLFAKEIAHSELMIKVADSTMDNELLVQIMSMISSTEGILSIDLFNEKNSENSSREGLYDTITYIIKDFYTQDDVKSQESIDICTNYLESLAAKVLVQTTVDEMQAFFTEIPLTPNQRGAIMELFKANAFIKIAIIIIFIVANAGLYILDISAGLIQSKKRANVNG